VEVGQELAAVEVPPGSLLAVVIDRQQGGALRAGEPCLPWMLGPHVDALAVHRQLDAAHLPRLEQPQQVAVELGVTHPAIVAAALRPLPSNTCPLTPPTEKPEAP
jgi:hypothetical protein